jgi:hypothetical protein
MRKIGFVAFLVFVAALFLSCPNPFDRTLSSQATDKTPPIISLLSPQDGSSYQSIVTVSGTVSDGVAGRVAALGLSVPGAEIEMPLVLGEGGAFSRAFSTAGINQPIILTLRAVDWNGNLATRSVTLFNAAAGPYVDITEPADMSYYSSVVRVAGHVLDAQGATTTADVKSASYRVPGTNVAGVLTLGTDGAYSFEFQTKDATGRQVIDGPRTIEVTATDLNLNQTTATITILRASGGNDIASFTVTPGNKRVTFTWEPVLHAASYSLYNPRLGLIKENVTSPYVWEGLENGVLCSFQLQALIPDDVAADAWSNLREAMPLSERTLAPWVKEIGYRSITIEWNPVSPSGEYRVERKEGEGPWLVRSITTALSLDDTGLTHDTWYNYRVTPMEQMEIPSATISAVPGRFPKEGVSLVGTCDTPGWAYGAAISGSFAYVADYRAGLRVIDFSDPSSPILAGGYDLAGFTYGVALAGHFAYLANGSSGLQVLDLSNPTSPTYVGGIDTPGSAEAVAVVGTFAFVADGNFGLQIIDVANPAAPVCVGTYNSPGSAVGIHVVGNFVYLADKQSGLQIIDVSVPAAPIWKGVFGTIGYANGVDVKDGFAYVSEGFVGVGGTDPQNKAGLEIVNITNPVSPTKAGGYTGFPAYAIKVVGSKAYLADYSAGLKVIDVSNPALPTLAAVYATTGNPLGITIAGCRVLLSASLAGLHVLDISLPASPLRVGGYHRTGVSASAVSSPYAYVADSENGMYILDISNPVAPRYVGGIENSFIASDVAVSGSFAYAVGMSSGLQIADVSNPASPVKISACKTSGQGSCVVLAGSYAYLADGSYGLHIVDISDPLSPFLTGGYDTDGTACGVAVSGDHAFIADGAYGLQIIDISVPTAPVRVSGLDTGGNAFGVAVSGHYAFVADYTDGLQIIDISDPAAPSLVGGYAPLVKAFDVSVVDSYAYVADYTGGLYVIDISNPAALTLVGSNQSICAYGVTIAGAFAYVADTVFGGLQIMNLGGD